MMDFIRSNVLEAKTSSEIRLKTAQGIARKAWFNSLEPERKLVWFYEQLGLVDNTSVWSAWKFLKALYEEDPEKYLEMIEVVKNWKF